MTSSRFFCLQQIPGFLRNIHGQKNTISAKCFGMCIGIIDHHLFIFLVFNPYTLEILAHLLRMVLEPKYYPDEGDW